MTCDRCLKGATVQIPEVGAWCGSHALSILGTWPQRHFREIESKNRAASYRSGAAA